MNVTVTGANSAVGRALLTQLVDQDDIRVVAAVRRREALAALPRSPHITPSVISYDHPESLTAALSHSGCVVHLAGILFESKTSDYQTANVGTTRALVEASTAAAVSHVVFISSLGADPHSANRYFRSKGEAERVMVNSGIDATIIRTPLLLGPNTAGGRALVRVAAQRSARILGGGAHVLRPLDVDDLCSAIVECCRRPATAVTVHELVGATTITYRELLRRTGSLLGHDLSIDSTPLWLARLGAALASTVRTGGMFYLLIWATIGFLFSGDALPEVFGLIPYIAAGAALIFAGWLLYFRGTLWPGSSLRDKRIFHAFRAATLKHYALFFLLRSPALLAAVFVYTVALNLFGVDASLLSLLGYLPVVFFAAAVPTPMRAAAITFWVILFPENEGQMAAFGFVQHNFFILFNALIGVAFWRRAQRELFG